MSERLHDGSAAGLPGPPAGLVTPEAVPLDLPVADLGSRGIAYFLDLVLIGLLLTALLLAGSAIEDTVPDLPTWLGVTLVLLLVFGVQLGYPVGFETAWRGRTPGKAALGLRVVTVEGAPVGFRHALIRAAMGLVDFQLTLGAAGVMTALFNQRTQRLGDIVAGTLVLRERTGAGTAVSERFAVPAGLEQHAEHLDVTALGPGDYQAVRSFLLRARGLDPATRRRLAERLGDALSPRVRPAPPAGVPAEAWLQAIAAAYQRRSRRPAETTVPGPAHPTSSQPAGTPGAEVYRPTGWEPPRAGRSTSADPEPPPTSPTGFTAPE